jgi:hypothetical protein
MAIIYTYPTKAAPTADDLVLISDAADSNKTKNAKISSIQSLVSGVNSVNGLAGAVLFNAGSSNLVQSKNTGTNTISYDLASSPTIAGTLTAAGLNIPQAGHDSPDTTITHFEQGLWTPNLQYYDGSLYYDVVGGSAPVAGASYIETPIGYYTRLNGFVTLHMKLRLTNSGSVFDCKGLRLTNIPFTADIYGGGGNMMIFSYSSSNGSSNSQPYPTGSSVHLNYLTVRNPDPTYFGGTDSFANTSGANKVLPLAEPVTAGDGGQIYLNFIGQANNTTRIATGTVQWWGTINYYTTAS